MIVRELLVKLGLDFDGGAVKKAEEKLGSLKNAAVSLAGAFATGALVVGLKHVVDEVTTAADRVAKTAQQFGVGVEALQGLEYAADLAGVGADQLRASLGFLVRQAGDAAGGSKEAAKKFADMGVSLYDAQGQLKPTEVLFRDAADAIAKIQNPTKRAAAAIELFGRDGARLVPLLKEGSAGLDKYTAELGDLGAVMSEDFTRASEEYRDNLTRADKALFGLKLTITKAVLPVFDAMARAFTATVGIMNKLLAGSRFVEAAMVALGAVAVVLAVKMALPFLPYIGMALLVVAATLAIIAVIDDLWVLLEGGDSLIGRLADAWTEWITAFMEPQADDHWLLSFLRMNVRAVFDLHDVFLRVIDAVSNAFSAFFTWVGEKLAAMGSTVAKVIPNGVLRFLGVGALADDQPSTGGPPPTFGGVPSLDAGAGVPMEAPGLSAGGMSYAPQNSVEVNITAAPGMDPNALAAETARQVDERLQAHAEDAFAALVPHIPGRRPAGAR